MEEYRFTSMKDAVDFMTARYPELTRKEAFLWIHLNEYFTDNNDKAIYIKPSMYTMPVSEVDTNPPEPPRPRVSFGRPGNSSQK